MTNTRDVEPLVERSQTGVGYRAATAPPRATFDGVQFTADWYLNHLLQGNVKMVNIGTGTSVVASAGAYDATKPDVHMQVPQGVTVFLVNMELNIDDLVDDQDMEAILAFADSLDTTPTGGTAQTVYNMKNDLAAGSGVTVQSDVTAITSPATAGNRYQEIWRANATLGAAPEAGSSEEGMFTRLAYSARAKDPMACVIGPSEITLTIGKATFNYFSTWIWVEGETGIIV
ncbi:hypothetical protein LCGC14_0532130 [marine sediment metagenome]|uniref:Uncharacterized protein n=1 Tax=marine sediment metagenome TaxID=412755 RepID=A0A0F9RZX8_9ZZZZ